MVSESDVVMGYRLLLGREPENSGVVAGQAGHYRSISELRAGFMTSPEYLAKLRAPVVVANDTGCKPLDWPATGVDVHARADVLDRMLDRIKATYQHLGASEPHWSVLTDDRYRTANIRESEASFFDSGELPVADMQRAAERSGLDLSRHRSCFELGCGVGRSTVWLARQFAQVTGADISSAHLNHAREAAARFGLRNISLLHLASSRQYRDLPAFDVFFSLIVLQHNPPPLIAFILRAMLQKLSPGGVAYFQVPTYQTGYSFSADEYLAGASPAGSIEVHCLPQRELFDIIDGAGCRILEMREDGALGMSAISNRLLLTKRQS